MVPVAIIPVRTLPDPGVNVSSGDGEMGVVPEITVSTALLLRMLPTRLPRSPAGAVAVIVETPGSAPVARPWDPRVANAEDEDQVTRLVRFSVLRSDMRPVAVNCWVWPSAMEATDGDTEIAVSTGDSAVWTTVRAAEPLSPPPRSPPSPRRPVGAVAVMVETPGSRPVASPWDPVMLESEASNPEDEDHVTRLVRSSVVPLDRTPVAVKGKLWPWVTEATAGDTKMELKVGEPSRGSACAESAVSATSTPATINTASSEATGRRPRIFHIPKPPH